MSGASDLRRNARLRRGECRSRRSPRAPRCRRAAARVRRPRGGARGTARRQRRLERLAAARAARGAYTAPRSRGRSGVPPAPDPPASHLERQARIDGRELARQLERRQLVAQILAHLAGDLGGVRDQRIERLVLIQPFRGGLRPDAGDARECCPSCRPRARGSRRSAPGYTSNFAFTPSRSRRVLLMVLTSVMRGPTSCAMSLSPVEISTSKPAAGPLQRERADHIVGLDARRCAAAAARAPPPPRAAAAAASADRPASACDAPCTDRTDRRGRCGPGASNTTAMRSGDSSFISLFSMLSTPSTAPVGSPCELVSGGSAWKARYRYEEPSTRSNFARGHEERGGLQACGAGSGVGLVPGAASGGAGPAGAPGAERAPPASRARPVSPGRRRSAAA